VTHFGVLVLTTEENIEEAVASLLAPYDENGEWVRPGSRWDWYAIGGRWTGALDPAYDPRKDPRNIETCGYCDGGITTQRIADMYPAYKDSIGKTCIQCEGTAKTVRWDLVAFDGDIRPIAGLDPLEVSKAFSSIVTPDGEWHEEHDGGYGWFGATRTDKKDEAWHFTVAELLKANQDATAVVVDCHV